MSTIRTDIATAGQVFPADWTDDTGGTIFLLGNVIDGWINLLALDYTQRDPVDVTSQGIYFWSQGSMFYYTQGATGSEYPLYYYKFSVNGSQISIRAYRDVSATKLAGNLGITSTGSIGLYTGARISLTTTSLDGVNYDPSNPNFYAGYYYSLTDDDDQIPTLATNQTATRVINSIYSGLPLSYGPSFGSNIPFQFFFIPLTFFEKDSCNSLMSNIIYTQCAIDRSLLANGNAGYYANFCTDLNYRSGFTDIESCLNSAGALYYNSATVPPPDTNGCGSAWTEPFVDLVGQSINIASSYYGNTSAGNVCARNSDTDYEVLPDPFCPTLDCSQCSPDCDSCPVNCSTDCPLSEDSCRSQYPCNNQFYLWALIAVSVLALILFFIVIWLASRKSKSQGTQTSNVKVTKV